MLKTDKKEKEACDSGGLLLFFKCLIMEKLKQVQSLLFPIPDWLVEHHPPSRGS